MQSNFGDKTPCVLEVGVAGGAGEGQDVADVRDAGEVHDHALEAHAEAGVLRGAVLAQLQIPPIVLGVEAEAYAERLDDVVQVLEEVLCAVASVRR